MNRGIFVYSIMASILASAVFVWALEPFSRWILQMTTESASAWRTSLQDRAFTNASLGTRDWLPVALYLNVLVASTLVLLVLADVALGADVASTKIKNL